MDYLRKFYYFLLSTIKKHGFIILLAIYLVIGLFLTLKFQSTLLDDDFYLLETSIITETFKQGTWFGNYATGVHGFLFKIPVSIIFLITGPSLAIATIWNIILGALILYIFYLILKNFFRNTLYALSGTLLLMSNFQFVLHLPTYMREFPVVLSVLLFIYLIIKKKSNWIVGLSLLLVLDSKELVFFMLLPGIVIYLFVYYWQGFNWKSVKSIVSNSFKLFLPSLIYLLLMLFTPIIPLNTVIFTVIPGITEGGVEFQLKHFAVSAATQNLIQLQNPEVPTIFSYISGIITGDNIISRSLRLVGGYLGKFLYPRSFSFLSIPKILFFPALFTSILLFKENFDRKKNFLLFLTFLLWSFISIFILRQSFERYLFPIIPVIVFFYLLFLKDIIKRKKIFIFVLIVSTLFSFLGLIFEADYIVIKLVLNLIILLITIFYYLFHKRAKISILVISILISIITFSVSIFYSYSNGQIYQYRVWGKDYEVMEVINNFDEEDVIMVNDPGWDLIIGTYRGNRQYNPEWKWALRDWVPRKKYLKMFNEVNTYTMESEEIEYDKNFVEIYGIEKIGLLVSNIPDQPFLYQEKLSEYLSTDWLDFERKVSLKNKDMYIFIVKE